MQAGPLRQGPNRSLCRSAYELRGAEHDVFTEAAIDDIFRFSSGAARLINKVCTHSLIYASQNKHRIIDDHMIKRVIQGELS
ncbi:general secretion pathway protein [Paenibacillus sp. ISL-20]|uniref:general secretion pathway protein n=1 Tax=Paenibacillus sp. ISL-20 TaxID=2819163 RepID=UPI0020363A45|nr:general secretion pathway protein [Paenibacillus sp. ISL-20]